MSHLRQVQAAQCFVQHTLDIHAQITKIPFPSCVTGTFKIIIADLSAWAKQEIFVQRTTSAP